MKHRDFDTEQELRENSNIRKYFYDRGYSEVLFFDYGIIRVKSYFSSTTLQYHKNDLIIQFILL